jgi:hypothetical protein
MESQSKSKNYWARIAGLNYIIVILLGILSTNFIVSNILVSGDQLTTIKNISENMLLFRISIVSEIVMYVLVILLSAALYFTLKTVNKNQALLALIWRIGEAIIGTVIVILGGIIPVLIVESAPDLNSMQLQNLIKVFTDIRAAGLDVVLIFIGIGGTLFFQLFLKSKYIPKLLSYWGIFTYVSMLIMAVVSILTSNFPESIKMLFFIPGGLFELIVGSWLLIKGVKKANFIKRSYRLEDRFTLKIGRQISFCLLQLNICIAGLLF